MMILMWILKEWFDSPLKSLIAVYGVLNKPIVEIASSTQPITDTNVQNDIVAESILELVVGYSTNSIITKIVAFEIMTSEVDEDEEHIDYETNEESTGDIYGDLPSL